METFKIISIVLLIFQVSCCNSKPTAEDESLYNQIQEGAAGNDA